MPHQRKISVIGLGYVGLPVAVAFGKKHPVIAFDIDAGRIEALKKGDDATGEVTPEDLIEADLLLTSNPGDLRGADFHVIAVPTPVNRANQPDLHALLSASEIAGSALKKGDIVVYESTVYPGATEEQCIPVLERSSAMKCGIDFFVGYSPERINPGDRQHTFTDIKKVIAAQDLNTLEIIAGVYASVINAGIHRAPSIKVAEAAKVIENTQRDLNIALMNELSLIFARLGIDTHDVLEAAGTKWNFLPFTPGLVGGHCIGVDPYYLTHKATMLGYIPQVILAGRGINDGMGHYIATQVIKTLSRAGINIRDSLVTILGFTFKENVPDIRNTRVIDVINDLKSYGLKIQVSDAHADGLEAMKMYGVELIEHEKLQPSEAMILAVPHRDYVDQGWELVTGLLKNGQGIVFDIKASLPRNTIPPGITLWRL